MLATSVILVMIRGRHSNQMMSSTATGTTWIAMQSAAIPELERWGPPPVIASSELLMLYTICEERNRIDVR